MTSTEQPSHPDGFLKLQNSSSDEPANAIPFALRSTTPSIPPVIEKRPAQASRVPPAAPSPPSRHVPLPGSNPGSPQVSPSKMGNEVVDNLSQWLFTEEEIQNSPSIADGISQVEERSRRAKGVNFIIQAGIILKIPQLTLGTAAVFFHRFYMRYSMVPEKGGLHHYNIAATALFLATKAEENCRKTKEIVIAVAKVAQKNASLIIDEQSKEFWRWKDSILLHEEAMLELLTFDVVLQTPYSVLYGMLKDLQIENNKPLRNVAWAFLNDSCMTTLSLRMRPLDIAVAAIFFSAKFNNEKIPDDDTGAAWWERVHGDPEKIHVAVEILNEFYVENPLKRSDNPYDQSPGSSAEDLDATRMPAESVSPSGRQQEEGHNMDDEANTKEELNGHTEERGAKNEDGLKAEPISNAGDDDAKLKEAANDPATHERTNGDTNGIIFHSPHEGKRKSGPENDNGDEPEAKKAKVDIMEEESEEGEVEE